MGGGSQPVGVVVGEVVHEFGDGFSAAVWLLEQYATAEQIQNLRNGLGRQLLKGIPVIEHEAAPWWRGSH